MKRHYLYRIVFVLFTFNYQAQEQNLADSEKVVEDLPIEEQLPVPSPLLDSSSTTGSASINVQAYRDSKNLYPISIVSINQYPIKPLLHGYDYHLMAGTYVLEVRPDFSLISDIKTFMNHDFEAKRIEITLNRNKQYSLGARINPEQLDKWQVQLFDILAPITRQNTQ